MKFLLDFLHTIPEKRPFLISCLVTAVFMAETWVVVSSTAVEQRIADSPARLALERWLATSAPAIMDLPAVKRPRVSGETAKSLTPLTFCCSGDLFWLGWWSLRCCQPGIIDTVCPEVKANCEGFLGCSAKVERDSRDYYRTLRNVTGRFNRYKPTASSWVWWSQFNINRKHRNARFKSHVLTTFMKSRTL